MACLERGELRESLHRLQDCFAPGYGYSDPADMKAAAG
jgi:hypothetical protein